MTPTDDAVTFIVPGDLHLTEAGLENHRVAEWVIDQVNDLIRPDFVQFIGDNVQDADESQFRIFDELRSRLRVPHFALVGDHDVKDDPGAERFRAHVGPTFGSTALRGVRFLRLDTQQSRPMGISGGQIGWLRNEVENAERSGERLLIFQHNYPFQIWENFDGPGIDDWRKLLSARRLVGVISGHTHYGQLANDGRNAFVAVRSIGDPEGGPPGYLVGHVRGEDLAVVHRSVEDRGPVALVTHPREAILATVPAHVVSGRDRLEVRSWSTSRVETVRGRVDEGDWFDLASSSSGYWTAPLHGERLAKGTHRFEARAVDSEGLEGRHEIEFLVDSTGRFTAIPRVAPVVDRTDYC